MSESEDTAAIAHRIVDANMYMTLATADADGRPWASPVWYAPAGPTEFLWVSAPGTRHSRNIAVRPEIAIVIFDSTVPVGAAEALYMDARAAQLSVDALEQAIAGYSQRSQACGAPAWEPADVQPPARFRLYRATASSQSVLGPHDERLPLTL
jgi:nitroimidazol reductase NimA-like FMN-containing flavoprotein (pyridoxamine 5'-phosphate oxidase superfamily)